MLRASAGRLDAWCPATEEQLADITRTLDATPGLDTWLPDPNAGPFFGLNRDVRKYGMTDEQGALMRYAQEKTRREQRHMRALSEWELQHGRDLPRRAAHPVAEYLESPELEREIDAAEFDRAISDHLQATELDAALAASEATLQQSGGNFDMAEFDRRMSEYYSPKNTRAQAYPTNPLLKMIARTV